jgi:hypothetical protein
LPQLGEEYPDVSFSVVDVILTQLRVDEEDLFFVRLDPQDYRNYENSSDKSYSNGDKGNSHKESLVALHLILGRGDIEFGEGYRVKAERLIDSIAQQEESQSLLRGEGERLVFLRTRPRRVGEERRLLQERSV